MFIPALTYFLCLCLFLSPVLASAIAIVMSGIAFEEDKPLRTIGWLFLSVSAFLSVLAMLDGKAEWFGSLILVGTAIWGMFHLASLAIEGKTRRPKRQLII